MAERATGPVQPPVIDLTARAGARADNDTRPPTEASSAHRNDNPPRSRRRLDDANWPLLGGVAVGGAVLGTILTYLLALALPLPSHQQQAPDLSAEVSAQGTQLQSLGTSVADLKTQTTKTQESLDATITQLDSGLTDVKKSVADVQASIPAAQPPVDLTPLEGEIRTLKAQVDAIAGGASGGDAAAIAQSLAQTEASITSLTTRLNGVDSTVSSMRTDLDAARKTLTDHIDAASPNEVGPALKLPLILSGLESAFGDGKPFADDLAALTTVMPGAAIPPALGTAASTGLSRPDVLLRNFEATLPAILAARDDTTGDWTSNAVDWAKSLLALRPAEEIEGDSPDAIVSRIEGAMGRNDYGTATTLLGQLPQPMQQAATPVSGDIAAHAAAEQFVADLRSKALSAAETAK
jgi:hypothetical protein